VVRIVNAAVSGRVRYKVEGLFRCDGLKAHLEAGLAGNGAIIDVSANTLTGNLLVRFNSGNHCQSIATLIQAILADYHAAAPEPLPADSIAVPAAQASASQPREATATNTSRAIIKKIRDFLPSSQKQAERPWHALETDEVLEELGSSPETGLSSQVASDRLRHYGANALPETDSRSRFSMFVDQFKSLPVALLGAAAGISILTGGVADALVILGVVSINGIIGYVTESEAERTIHSLQTLVKPLALVVRDAQLQALGSEQVVPGDVLVLRPGASIAADGRLLEAEHLTIDESVLTGESLPVVKTTTSIHKDPLPVADRLNMVYKGTVVTGGQGLAMVVATGRYTEVGQLQMLLGEATSPETPMERQLNRLGDQLVLISGAACGIVFVIGLLRGYGFVQMFKIAISLAVAAVPEGLPAVATTTLALGIRSMRKHRVLIRKLEAVETLGSVQTICFDKTGTVTLNKMSVVRVFTGMQLVQVIDGQFIRDRRAIDPLTCDELLRLIQTAVLCNETEVTRGNGGYGVKGSPTENALIHLAFHASVEVIELRRQYPLLRTNYRAENRQFMGTLHTNGNQGQLVAIKGSPNEVLAMCDRHLQDGAELPLTEEDRYQIELENEHMAGDSLRVLGVAFAMVDHESDFGSDHGFIWLGLIGMADPIRPGVKDLIAQFHHAGIDTIMITGDQGPTAYAIGKEMNLSRGRDLEIMDSTHLENIELKVIRALSERIHVYARVSPAHKLKIVQALQSTGKVVAMTGDGINDGPALKAADIGIAMGAAGTDMAREVADVILEEDNLETMIIAVRDGRTIYNNIRKALHFMLATNFSEIMVMFLTVAAGVGSPLNAMQLLWINLISDIFPGLALAMEAPESDVLERPPRSPDEPIVKVSDFKRLTFESAALSVSSLGAYAYGIMRYGMGAQASTMAFQSLTLGQLLHAISCRSETHSIFSRETLPPNRYLNYAMGGSFLLQLMTMLVPGLRGLLGITPIGVMDAVVIGGTAVAPLLVNEATKTTTH
jgi:P-type Ca2+ transporter type 2C